MTLLHPYSVNATISDARISQRMLDLVQLLSVEEKVALLAGRDFSSLAAVPRLGIPSIKVADSTSAVKGSGFGHPLPTACFPNTAALAATWNRALLQEMGKAVAGQAKHKAAQVVLGPTVNIHRDPRGGRNFESFSEDPILSGHLAAALVNGIQSQGIGACIKHFVCNECETMRKKYNVSVDDRALREIYMLPFQWIVREARPTAIMTAYNKFLGTYASESSHIRNVVRQEWGFDGLIMSDWFGTESRLPAIEAGLDVEMPGPSKCRGQPLFEDIKSGKVGIDVINERVLEVLKFVSRTSEFHSTAAEESGEDDATNALARQVASESIVLLKNKGDILPMNIKSKERLAVVGQLSLEYSGGGGSAAGTPQYIQRPYDCIRSLHPQPDLVTLSTGVQLHRSIPMVLSKNIIARTGGNGVDIRYYNDDAEATVLTEFSPVPLVFMLGHVKPGLKETGFTYEMTTSLTPNSSGNHTLAVTATGAFQLFVDGKEVLAGHEPSMSVEDFLFVPYILEIRCSVPMIKNQSYSIKLLARSRRKLEVDEPTPHSAKLCFLEEYSDESAIAEAAQAASGADMAVVFAGRNAEWESEGSDLADLKLPKNQDKLIKSVANACKSTVVVLYGGNPFDVSNWIDDVDAVIFAQYPGQEGGAAVADVLTGAICPSGRLPMTWPKRIEDVPTFKNFPSVMTDVGCMLNYDEGLKVGYRYYLSQPESARWNFGHGLSYTSFKFSNLRVERMLKKGEDNMIELEVEVENTGDVAGAEVIQAYIEDLEASVWRPVKELKGFEKVFLQPKEKKVVKVKMVEKYALSFWDKKLSHWVAESGDFLVRVENLVAPLVLEESFTWKGV